MTVPVDDLLDRLVDRGDLDGLLRLIDERTTAHDWTGLLRLRDASRAAVATGRQLWPAASWAEYRLALSAPPEHAAVVVDDERAGRFSPGPLPEVAAQHHTWAEMAPYLGASPRAAVFAHERVVRGEALDPATVAHLPPVLELPYELAPWEPAYPLAEYLDHAARFPSPPLPTGGQPAPRTTAPVTPLDAHEMDDVTEAVRQLTQPWTAHSEGRVEVHGVTGSAADAVRDLTGRRPNLVPLEPGEALAWLGWAGASGGAHGRRRGVATGRFGTWWLLGALGDLLDRWPPEPAALGDLVADLRWWWWDVGEPPTGWRLQLVVEDPLDTLAWAFSAVDAG